MDNNLIFLNACRNGQKNIVQIFLKKGGIDLSLNKWVELVSLCTTDFSLTGIFLLFPFSPLRARV
mgnify:CR=1 FL=1